MKGVQTESETAHVQEILPLSRVHRADQGCGQDRAKRKIGAGNKRASVWWWRGSCVRQVGAVKKLLTSGDFLSSPRSRNGKAQAIGIQGKLPWKGNL